MPCGVGGGYPPELVDGGVDQGPWLQERVGGGRGGWMAVSKEGGGLGLGWLFQRGASPGKGWLGSSTGGGKGLGGNPRASVPEG